MPAVVTKKWLVFLVFLASSNTVPTVPDFEDVIFLNLADEAFVARIPPAPPHRPALAPSPAPAPSTAPSTAPSIAPSSAPSLAPSPAPVPTKRKALKKKAPKEPSKEAPYQWSDAQEKLLLDVLRCAGDTGIKGQGGYKKQVYKQVVIGLQAATPGLRLSAEQVASKVEYFKKWRAWMVLVENSGFGFDR
ncbi:hypothetical protein B0T26DRAFT_717069 [Lasiosphaeria miniovina]|uniref:Myb/SANT-like domain-containing protein n=1 Tax=Lasiosphaeria miniovina TaxID=1954250 RepID=A0AA40ACC6_9PEZI|nr:uncharacterized protein B0T26DRAFT_717069 [Lasiosphaeria miniovina]KAK0713307.1 hypothetical protein B0T26DRAFT_717069 [Lasiosphaeria miniovina]